MKEIRLPSLGEDVTSATVTAVMVKEGDKVKKDDVLLEVESEKTALEVPSPEDGKVREIRVAEDDEVEPDQVILIFE